MKQSNLVHRRIAYKYIYLPNRNKYPLKFSKYIVHHKDGNKRNNNVDNLELMTQEDHSLLHGHETYVDSNGYIRVKTPKMKAKEKKS